MSRRSLRITAAALLAALFLPAAALADGDPASDVLLGQNVFYPYSPSVAHALQYRLDAETAAAKRAHFPIKVALIESPADLGAIPSLWGKPQQYAEFLDTEISFTSRQPLLVVMPAGYGVQGLPPAATRLAASLPKPSADQTNGLARAAIDAVSKLAAVTGHPLDASLGTPTATTSNGPSVLVLTLLALSTLATAATILALRHHRTARRIAVTPKRRR